MRRKKRGKNHAEGRDVGRVGGEYRCDVRIFSHRGGHSPWVDRIDPDVVFSELDCGRIRQPDDTVLGGGVVTRTRQRLESPTELTTIIEPPFSAESIWGTAAFIVRQTPFRLMSIIVCHCSSD